MIKNKLVTFGVYRTIDIHLPEDAIKEYGIWRVLWGMDIFINNIPVIKSMALANVLVWLVMWLALK